MALLSKCRVCGNVHTLTSHCLEKLIGEPPEGSHPDEWKPRAETWHQERQNWSDEVLALRTSYHKLHDALSDIATSVVNAENHDPVKGECMLELTELKNPESQRVYTFANGEQVALKGVTHFLARESGTHRLKTSDGKLHIIPPTWIHIEIDADSFSL